MGLAVCFKLAVAQEAKKVTPATIESIQK
jgi:hypothetical protein